MSANTPLSRQRRMGRLEAGGVDSFSLLDVLKGLGNQIVAAAEQALQGIIGRDPRLVPIPIRTKAGQRRDQSRSHD